MSSFFGSGGARPSGPSGQPDQARLAEAAMELEAVSDLFNRIVASCHAKCVSTRYAEPELNKGEAVCIDRLVFPFPLFYLSFPNLNPLFYLLLSP